MSSAPTAGETPTGDVVPAQALAQALAQAPAEKRAKRYWQVTNNVGEPLDSRKSKLEGASPRKAALKAVTQYAPDSGEHQLLYLREVGRGKKGGARAGGTKFKLHVYEGWKEPLMAHERSGFTANTKIEYTPHAVSVQVDTLIIRKQAAPASAAVPKEQA